MPNMKEIKTMPENEIRSAIESELSKLTSDAIKHLANIEMLKDRASMPKSEYLTSAKEVVEVIINTFGLNDDYYVVENDLPEY